jgi:D-alanine--poly(phosphoribitol) ligase subunit 2
VFIVEANIRETIIRLFRQKSQMKSLGEDDMFFELGVSSLTIIELQMGVEGALGVTVPTSELMRLGTMRGWIEAYSTRARQGDAVSTASA